MGDLGHDTRPDGGGGTYRTALSEEWGIWGPMGGYVAAVALRAIGIDVATRWPEMRPASMSCQFLGVADFDLVDVAVEVRMEGRSSVALGARLSQRGRPILDAQAWFCEERELLRHDTVEAPEVPDPEGLAPLEELREGASPYPFWDNLDGRALSWVPADEWARAEPGAPEWFEWLAFRPDPATDDPLIDAARLVILADLPSWPAAHRAHPQVADVVAPNLDLAVQFHRFDPDSRWLLCEGRAPVAERGLIGFASRVYSRDRRLLASGSGQLRGRRLRSGPPQGN